MNRNLIKQVVITSEVEEVLSREEICQALALHSGAQAVTTFRSPTGTEVLVYTDAVEEVTRVVRRESLMAP